MPFARDPRRDRGIAPRVHTDQEERGLHIYATKNVEHVGSEGFVGAVVEGQRNHALLGGALPVGSPESVRPGRERVVGADGDQSAHDRYGRSPSGGPQRQTPRRAPAPRKSPRSAGRSGPFTDFWKAAPKRLVRQTPRHGIRGVEKNAPQQRAIPSAAGGGDGEAFQQNHAAEAAQPLGQLCVALKIEFHVPAARALQHLAAPGEIGAPEVCSRRIPAVPSVQYRKDASREDPSLPIRVAEEDLSPDGHGLFVLGVLAYEGRDPVRGWYRVRVGRRANIARRGGNAASERDSAAV